MPAPDVIAMLYRLLNQQSPSPAPIDQQMGQAIAAQQRATQVPQARFDMEGEPLSPSLPPGLPDAVMRSILTQPSYGEGQKMGQIPPSLMQEYSTNDITERERLSSELDLRDIFRRWGEPITEGKSYPNKPVYPSPLNQFMGRLPGMGLY